MKNRKNSYITKGVRNESRDKTYMEKKLKA